MQEDTLLDMPAEGNIKFKEEQIELLGDSDDNSETEQDNQHERDEFEEDEAEGDEDEDVVEADGKGSDKNEDGQRITDKVLKRILERETDGVDRTKEKKLKLMDEDTDNFIRANEEIDLTNCPEPYRSIIQRQREEISFLRRMNDSLQSRLFYEKKSSHQNLQNRQLKILSTIPNSQDFDKKFINKILPMVFGDQLYRDDALISIRATKEYEMVQGMLRCYLRILFFNYLSMLLIFFQIYIISAYKKTVKIQTKGKRVLKRRSALKLIMS